MKQQVKVSGIFHYPIKSCWGWSLQKENVVQTGLFLDRKFGVIDEYGTFVAQRGPVGIKSMCQIKPYVHPTNPGHHIFLSAPGMGMEELPSEGLEGKMVSVKVWDDEFLAIDQGDKMAEFFTAFLSRERPGKYRLVRMPDVSKRPSKRGDARIGFADAFPFLIVSQASLDDLNNRIKEGGPLPMNRFRPNIVLDGCPPYWEDEISSFRIGDIEFTNMGPCIRCPITATDQETTILGKEPLKTLATYRRYEAPDGRNGVIFGSNYNHLGTGEIKVGNILEF